MGLIVGVTVALLGLVAYVAIMFGLVTQAEAAARYCGGDSDV